MEHWRDCSVSLFDVVKTHLTHYLASGHAPPYELPDNAPAVISAEAKACGMFRMYGRDLGDLLARVEMFTWGWAAGTAKK